LRAADGYSAPASHQTPAQTPPTPQEQPSSGQNGQTYRDIGSDPSQWNNSGNFWLTRWRDQDSRWRGDHDSHWNFFNPHHDGDSHSPGSNDYGDSN